MSSRVGWVLVGLVGLLVWLYFRTARVVVGGWLGDPDLEPEAGEQIRQIRGE
jgi:hypothetical protein